QPAAPHTLPQEFASGEALQLQCLCKGEVKGNLQCDICKATIANLPDIDPAILAAKEATRRRRDPAFLVSSDLTALDYVFDAVRVTWVVVIVCILFTNGMNTSNTFLIGATAGLCYAIISMVLHELWKMYRRRRREAAAAVAAASGGLPASSPAAPAAATSARSPTSRRGSPSGGLTQPLLVPGSAAHDIVLIKVSSYRCRSDELSGHFLTDTTRAFTSSGGAGDGSPCTS
ncbi:hypothetical protein QJQ45_016636, partial [Haematococcus lacustris]